LPILPTPVQHWQTMGTTYQWFALADQF